MKRLIVNFVALLVIGLGAYHLSGVQAANAATNQVKVALADCDCKDGSSCSGDRCQCNDGGGCEACSGFLFFGCKL